MEVHLLSSPKTLQLIFTAFPVFDRGLQLRKTRGGEDFMFVVLEVARLRRGREEAECL